MNATNTSKSAGLSPSATAMIEARGLDADLCERLGLTSGKDRTGSEWIAFPFERDGIRVNRKFRSVEGKQFKQDAGGEQILWRYDCIADQGLADQPLIITEGEMDCVAAIQAGFWRSVAFSAGAPSETHSEEDLRASARYASVRDPVLDGVGEIIIAVDSDAKGIALRTDLTALLRPARCKFVTYPHGCKDLNDVLRQHGAEKVREILNGARWVNVAGVYLPSELPPLSPLVVWRPRVYQPIDDLVPICPGHVSVWTGLAGDGKSTLVNACVWSLADRYGLRIAAAPFESTPQREYFEDLVAHRCGRAIGDQINPATAEDIQEARDWAERHIVFLNADGYAMPGKSEWIDATLEWFATATETAVRRFGCRIVVLDPWSQMDHEQNSHEREDQYVRRVLKGFKRLARELDIHVAIVAHPAKPKRAQDGSYPVPEGYDISGCYSADTEVLTHRGWLMHADVTLDDDVACFDLDAGITVYAKPSRVIKKHFVGEMHRFRGYGYDLLVTPEHRMVVKPMWPNPAKKWQKDAWQFWQAQELPSAPFTLPLAAAMDHPPAMEDTISREWAAIAGWYVAEGCRQSAGICIAQAEGEKSDEIADLLTAAKITYKINKSKPGGKGGTRPMNAFYIGYRFNKANAPLIAWIKDNCGEQGSANKRIPPDVMRGSLAVKRAFLHAYLDGDGSPGRPGAFRGTTTSQILRDQLQQMCLEMGLPFCWREDARASENHSRKWSFNIGRPDRTAVAIRTGRNLTMEAYDGDVWCLTVPTGAYVTRRNGRATICGNSAHWKNAPDLGVTAYRDPPKIEDPANPGEMVPDPKSTRVLIKVWKVKFHRAMNRPGEVYARVDPMTGRYSSPEHWEANTFPRKWVEPTMRALHDDDE